MKKAELHRINDGRLNAVGRWYEYRGVYSLAIEAYERALFLGCLKSANYLRLAVLYKQKGNAVLMARVLRRRKEIGA